MSRGEADDLIKAIRDVAPDELIEALRGRGGHAFDVNEARGAWHSYSIIIKRMREFVASWKPGAPSEYPSWVEPGILQEMHDWSVAFVQTCPESRPTNGLEERMQGARRAAMRISRGETDLSGYDQEDLFDFQMVWLDSHTTPEQIAEVMRAYGKDETPGTRGCALLVAGLVFLGVAALGRR